MKTCLQAPTDKRAFGKAVGDELLKRHGKQRYYSLQRIQAAVDSLGFPAGLSSWAFALYAAPDDFEKHRAKTGENRDYGSLKAEMFDAMTDGASWSWFDIDMSWLEWPDIDFSGIFDFFDFSP